MDLGFILPLSGGAVKFKVRRRAKNGFKVRRGGKPSGEIKTILRRTKKNWAFGVLLCLAGTAEDAAGSGVADERFAGVGWAAEASQTA